MPIGHSCDVGDYVVALAWAPDGRSLAAASGDGGIAIIDATSGTIRQRLAGHDRGISALAWRPDGHVLASGGHDGLVRRWDAESGEPHDALPVGKGWVEQVGWSNAGSYLAASAGKRVRCWDSAGELVRDWDAHDSTVTALRWHPTGEELVAAFYGGLARWTPYQSTPVARHAWKGSVLTVEWSPDGRYIATGDQDSTMHFWTIADGRSLQMWGYLTKVQHLAWDPTARFLATGGSETVTVWDCQPSPEGTKPLMFEAHEKVVSALAYQRRGSLLLSGGRDGRVFLWQPGRRSQALGRLSTGSPISAVAWHPDDVRFAVGAENGTVFVMSSART